LVKHTYKQILLKSEYDNCTAGFYILGDMSDIYCIKIKIGVKEIVFKCSYMLFKASVNDLAKLNTKYTNKRADLIKFDYTNLQ
jgi:hypothetical protein